jgi:hypothetical protein
MLSADFTELTTPLCLTISAPFGVLEQAFQGVTPSFHLSDYQFYETAILKLLSILQFYWLHA